MTVFKFMITALVLGTGDVMIRLFLRAERGEIPSFRHVKDIRDGGTILRIRFNLSVTRRFWHHTARTSGSRCFQASR